MLPNWSRKSSWFCCLSIFFINQLYFCAWNLCHLGQVHVVRCMLHHVSYQSRVLRYISLGELFLPLRWRHHERDGFSNHQPHDCLPTRLFRRRSKITSKLRVTALCVGNSLVTGEFPAQKASIAENVPIWRLHHAVWMNVHGCEPSQTDHYLVNEWHPLFMTFHSANLKNKIRWQLIKITVTIWYTCISNFKSSISIICNAIYGAVCIQLPISRDDCEYMCTLSFYHQIERMHQLALDVFDWWIP